MEGGGLFLQQAFCQIFNDNIKEKRPYPNIVDKVDGLNQVGVEDEDEVLLQQGHVPLVLPSSKIRLLELQKKLIK